MQPGSEGWVGSQSLLPGTWGKQAVTVQGWRPGPLSPLCPSQAATPLPVQRGKVGRRGACGSRRNTLCISPEAKPLCCVFTLGLVLKWIL